jgi:hypothetical protein
MPNPTWPGTLPVAWGGDAQRVRDDASVLRTKMDAGPAKMRPRSTADFISTPFSFLVTTAQKETLDAFYLTTLSRTLPFDWTDFSVAALPTRTFRFVRPPRYEYRAGPYWTAIVEIEQLP